MKNKFINYLVLLSCLNVFISTDIAFGAANFNYTPRNEVNYSNNNTLKGSVVYTPIGLTTNAIINEPISSETMYQGQGVTTTLANDLSYNGKLIAESGSTISGSVISIKKSGRANHNGSVYIRFNSLTTPQGYRIPISAVIQTTDKSGVLSGGTKKDAVKNYTVSTAVGAGAGALTGTVVGAIAGGSIGTAAAITTAIGAGLGVGKELIDKGKSVEIPSGATVQLYFDQPITISAPNGYKY